MPHKRPPEQSPIVIATQWATRIMTLAIEMVVPGLGGIWLDGRLGTKALFTLFGFAFGSLRPVAAFENDKTARRADELGFGREPGTTRTVNGHETSTSDDCLASWARHACRVALVLTACYLVAAPLIYSLQGGSGLIAAAIAAARLWGIGHQRPVHGHPSRQRRPALGWHADGDDVADGAPLGLLPGDRPAAWPAHRCRCRVLRDRLLHGDAGRRYVVVCRAHFAGLVVEEG